MATIQLNQRRPWSDGIDDKYVSRFIIRSLRFAIRRGLSVDEWFSRLPKNLQTNHYYAGVMAMLMRVKG